MGRNKRAHDDDSDQEPAQKQSKPSDTSVDSLRSLAKDYESQLRAKHNDAYTPFQYKLWAEMYAKGGHNSLDDPPHASMFSRETKPQNRSAHDHAAVMVSVIDKLCSAIATKAPKQMGSTLSPMKRAELRSTYMKQLSELRQLHDNGVLTEDEYEEQREELVQLMRQLKTVGTKSNHK